MVKLSSAQPADPTVLWSLHPPVPIRKKFSSCYNETYDIIAVKLFQYV